MVKVMGFKLLNFLTICVDDWVIRSIGASNRKSQSGRTWHTSFRGRTRENSGVQEQPGVVFRINGVRHLSRHLSDYYSWRVPSKLVYDATWRLMSLLVIHVVTTGLVLL